MYRALFDYSSDEVDVLPIRAGEKFIFIHEHDAHWWKMQGESGMVGLVPANYLEPDEKEMENPVARKAILQSIERAMEVIHTQATSNGGVYTNEQRSNLKKLLEHRKSILSQVKGSSSKRLAPKPPTSNEREPPPQPRRPAPTLPTDLPSTSKRKAPTAPSNIVSSNTISPKAVSSKAVSSNSVSISSQPLKCTSCSSSYSEMQQKALEINIPPKFVTDLLEELRINSGIGYGTSFTVTETVLNHIKNQIPSLAEPMDKIIQEIKHEKENAVHSDESLLNTHDGKSIETILIALTEHKDDAQQRSWALHMDEPTIVEQLSQLLDLLVDSNQKVSKVVIGQNDFEYLQSMVAYFQMEHRPSIRLQLLQVFGCVCGIDNEFITQLLCSVLPGELARTILATKDGVQLQLYSSLVLTMIFSTAEPVPYWLYEQLDKKFVTFLINNIENAPEGGDGDQIIDSFVGVLLAFNQHFADPKTNIVMKVLADLRTAKTVSEKVMLFFNRGEDPALLFKNYPKFCSNSVFKFLSDTFSSRRTSGLFFTSDMMVLLEIVLRQITDLNPGNQLRTEYLSLLHLVLTNTNYAKHKHLRSELNNCLQRISQEIEPESQKDQYIVKEIFTQFAGLFES